MGAVLGDGADHVQRAQAAAGDDALRGHLDPLLRRGHLPELLEGPHVGDLALEHVGVGHHQRALGAVDLDDALTGERRVEADQGVRLLAGLEGGQHGHGGGDLDGEGLPRALPHLDGALGVGAQPHRRHRGDRAEQADQGGQVVGTDVQQRARAAGEEEAGVGVEDLGALVLHGGLGEQRPPDDALGDGALGGLHAGAEHGVGGDADAQARPLGGGQQRGGGLAVQAQRLLAPDVLAGLDGGEGHLGVDGGDGQVDHQLDVGVREDLLGGAGGGDAVLGGLAAGALDVEVAEGEHLHVGEGAEVLEVGVGDDADADQADADGSGAATRAHAASPFSRRKR